MEYKEPSLETLKNEISLHKQYLVRCLAMIGERMTESERSLLKTLIQDPEIQLFIAREELCMITIKSIQSEVI